MRYLILGAIAGVCMGTAMHAQTVDPQIVAPINKFIDAFNSGDVAGAAATHAAEADLAILDEVSPYLWRGPRAFHSWAADLEADAKKRGITEQKVTISAPTRVETNGREAYVVVPAVYTIREGGVAKRGDAQMTFALRKGAAGWLIHGWTWTGPKVQEQKGSAQR